MPDTALSKIQKTVFIIFGVVVFLFFLAWKLPQARIQNLVLAHIQILAGGQGLSFSADKVGLSILFGPAIKIYNAELKSLEDEKLGIKIPYLRIRPQFFSLLTSNKTIGILAQLSDGKNPAGEISGTIGGSKTGVVVDLDFNSVRLGAISLIKKFLPIELSGELNGQVGLDLNFSQTQKSEGKVLLTLNKVITPSQALYGFNLPQLGISESKIEFTVSQGRILIQDFNIGKDIKQDDLVAKITGDGIIKSSMNQSTINTRAVFELSDRVRQSFPILNALLMPAKAPDGKFSYRFNGPVSGLESVPGG